MKITEIQSGNTQKANYIRCAFGQRSGSVLVEQFKIAQLQSLPSIFIRAIVNSNILTEADKGMLGDLLATGLAHLKSAMTPGTSKDLELLLTMMAPQGGGVKSVESLLEVARQAPIHDNEDWWNTFYETFNINDDLVKQDIRDRVSTEIPQAEPQRPQVSGGEHVGGDKFQSFVDQMSGLAQKRQTNQARQAEIKDQMADLRQQPQNEDTQAMIAELMCETSSVKQNFNIIASLMYTEIRTISEGKLPPLDNKILFAILREGTLDDLRTYAANPNYAKAETQNRSNRTRAGLQQRTDQADGKRVAKLAINIAKNHLRQKFNAALQDAGLLPGDIIKSYAVWKKLSQIPHKSEEQLAQYQIATKKLKQAIDLFKPISPNGPEKNPNDPFDPGEPEIVDADMAEPYAPERPPKAQGKPPHYIGDDEPTPETETEREYKRIARAVGWKMVEKAKKAKETGGDVHYTVRSYLGKVHRALDPKLAEYLWGLWRQSTGHEDERPLDL